MQKGFVILSWCLEIIVTESLSFVQEVCFMLPPLLSLLLDCAKQTDQAVVSLSLGALVHLIEVGGHQFSESDWDTLLKSIRCVSLIIWWSFLH